MEKSVTVTLSNKTYKPLINVGDKILVGKKSLPLIMNQTIRNKNLVGRLFKKKFKPTLITTSVDLNGDSETATLKPYNF